MNNYSNNPIMDLKDKILSWYHVERIEMSQTVIIL